MCTSGKRIVVALFGAALFVAAAPALAQNQPEQKPAEQGQKPPATPTEPGKDDAAGAAPAGGGEKKAGGEKPAGGW